MMGISTHKTISDHAMTVRSWIMHHFHGKFWRNFDPPQDEYFDQQLMTADDEGMAPVSSASPPTRKRRSKRTRTSKATH